MQTPVDTDAEVERILDHAVTHPELYKMLRVAPDAEAHLCTKAFKNVAKRVHTDKFMQRPSVYTRALLAFQKLNWAHDILGGKKLRTLADGNAVPMRLFYNEKQLDEQLKAESKLFCPPTPEPPEPPAAADAADAATTDTAAKRPAPKRPAPKRPAPEAKNPPKRSARACGAGSGAGSSSSSKAGGRREQGSKVEVEVEVEVEADSDLPRNGPRKEPHAPCATAATAVPKWLPSHAALVDMVPPYKRKSNIDKQALYYIGIVARGFHNMTPRDSAAEQTHNVHDVFASFLYEFEEFTMEEMQNLPKSHPELFDGTRNTCRGKPGNRKAFHRSFWTVEEQEHLRGVHVTIMSHVFKWMDLPQPAADSDSDSE